MGISAGYSVLYFLVQLLYLIGLPFYCRLMRFDFIFKYGLFVSGHKRGDCCKSRAPMNA